MISAQDKRFQDIEKLIGGLITKTNALEEKLADYDSIKTSLDSLNSNLSILVEKVIKQDKQMKENLGLCDKNQGFLHGLINDLTKYIDSMKKENDKTFSKLSVNDSTIVRIFEKLDFVDKRLSTLLLKSDFEKKEVEIANFNKSLDEKIFSTKRELSLDIHSINEAVLKQISFIENSLQNGYQASDSKISQKFENVFETIQQKFVSLAPQKDNFGERMKPLVMQIQELKNEVANMFIMIKEVTNQIPVANDYSEKFKTLENSIASIFTMLKKYERG